MNCLSVHYIYKNYIWYVFGIFLFISENVTIKNEYKGQFWKHTLTSNNFSHKAFYIKISLENLKSLKNSLGFCKGPVRKLIKTQMHVFLWISAIPITNYQPYPNQLAIINVSAVQPQGNETNVPLS